MKSKLLGNLMEPQGSMHDGREWLPYEPLHQTYQKPLGKSWNHVILKGGAWSSRGPTWSSRAAKRSSRRPHMILKGPHVFLNPRYLMKNIRENHEIEDTRWSYGTTRSHQWWPGRVALWTPTLNLSQTLRAIIISWNHDHGHMKNR